MCSAGRHQKVLAGTGSKAGSGAGEGDPFVGGGLAGLALDAHLAGGGMEAYAGFGDGLILGAGCVLGK